jgi:predicted  nucleic acid-binding Zn-ribbon protein
MSSAENDLTQSLLAEARRKDELLDAYREKIKILEKLIQIKDERIKGTEDAIEELRTLIKESMAQTDKVIEIANNVLS